MKIIDRIRLLLVKEDKDLYLSLYNILGVLPKNIEHYKLALMHKSIAHRNAKGRPVNNERLEFLGDAVLDSTVGHIVYEQFPGKREGFLTNTRSKLVQRETLGRLAKEMGITDLILSSGRSASHNSYMGGNAFEALVGALYLDYGYDACMTFVKDRILKQHVNINKVAYKEVNFKSKLLEWSQKNRVAMEYRKLMEDKDKNGSPVFEFIVVIEGVELSKGKGFSKKEAQQHASEETLKLLRKQPTIVEEIFAAKTARTQMEEMPIQVVPDVSKDAKHDDFIVANTDTPVAADDVTTPSTPSETVSADIDNIDFTDITATPKQLSREEIIAAAEAAAFED